MSIKINEVFNIIFVNASINDHYAKSPQDYEEKMKKHMTLSWNMFLASITFINRLMRTITLFRILT